MPLLKPRINIILNRDKLETRQGCPLSLSLISIILEVLANAIKKKINVIKMLKEDINMSVFLADTVGFNL